MWGLPSIGVDIHTRELKRDSPLAGVPYWVGWRLVWGLPSIGVDIDTRELKRNLPLAGVHYWVG